MENKREYIRLVGLYSRTMNGENNTKRNFMLSNNIEKRLRNGDGSKDGIRLSVMNNDRKDFTKPNDPDGHLLIERKHVDDLIKYLEIVRDEYAERRK